MMQLIPCNNRWLVLVAVSTALFLISIDMTVLYTVLPRLTHDLGAGSTQKLWVIDVFPLVMAGLLPTMGALGDRVGHRWIFLWGLVAFGIASVVAACAPSANALIAARAFLGVGASMMMPATLSLLRLTFRTDKERALAIGIWAAVFSGGFAIGPLIGGALLDHFWWGSVFLINVPVVMMAIVLTVLVVPRVPGNPERQIDPVNAFFAMAAMVGSIYAIMEVAKTDASRLDAILSGIVGLAFGTAFVRRQSRSKNSMIDFTLFSNDRFTAGAVTILVATVTGMGVQLALTQRLQLVTGYSPFDAAVLMLPISIASFVAGPLIGAVLHKIGIGRALWTSLTIAATGLVCYAIFRNGGAVAQAASLAVFGFGVGAGSATASTSIMINAPEEKTGMAASIESVAYELGGVLGVAIMGSILSFTYTTVVILPQGLPDFTLARDSLDDALLLAEHMSGVTASILIVQAKAAFEQAFVVVLAAGTTGLLLAAGTIAWLTRRTKATAP